MLCLLPPVPPALDHSSWLLKALISDHCLLLALPDAANAEGLWKIPRWMLFQGVAVRAGPMERQNAPAPHKAQHWQVPPSSPAPARRPFVFPPSCVRSASHSFPASFLPTFPTWALKVHSPESVPCAAWPAWLAETVCPHFTASSLPCFLASISLHPNVAPKTVQ